MTNNIIYNIIIIEKGKGLITIGMDFYIYSTRNREVFKHEGWWDSSQVKEEFYARKNWEIVEHCSFIPKDYESGTFIELTLENIEEMIQVACKYRNYFDNYNDVPKLCELRDKMEYWESNPEEANGRKMFYEYDW